MNPSVFDRLGATLTSELLALLDEAFPHRCPNPQDSVAEMWMKAGERRAVEILMAKFAEAQESGDILNSNHQ
jgi:hypothetical protein